MVVQLFAVSCYWLPGNFQIWPYISESQ